MKILKQISEVSIKSGVSQYFLSAAVIGITTFLCSPLSSPQSYHIVSFILLFVVALLAAFMGIGPVLLASTLSAIAWNYFFIPPYHTFNIAKTEDKFIFGSFFVIALLNGILTNRIRRQEIQVREREDQTNALFQLTRELSKASGIENVIEVSQNDFKKRFNSEAYFILKDLTYRTKTTENTDPVCSKVNPDPRISEWVLANSRKAGRYTEIFPEAEMTYYPLTGTRLNPGVIAFRLDRSTYGKKDAFWSTYISQVSNALEREALGELALKARVLNESDKLYKTLFNLISHEFRIPIAAIMGASDTLLTSHTSENNREELYSEIFKSSARLNHLIENLLNMSRLESGKISLRPDWCDINDLIYKVCGNLKEELGKFNLKKVIPDDLPLVKIDFGLMEQVVYNLLLNSCQYSPSGSDISIEASYLQGDFMLRISDKGPGFPKKLMPRVFDKFFRVDESKPGGLGLGLSIVKGIIDAHKGIVQVKNLPAGGAEFTITIPSEEPDIDKQKLV